MAVSCIIILPIILPFFINSRFLVFVSAAPENICPIQSLYQLGDSIADVGNLIRDGAAGARSNCGRLPYGQTFGRPTGRCSDGLLMIDQIAFALGLPLLEPYLKPHANTDHGVNFAVVGSTALDDSFFLQRNMQVPYANNNPLSIQLRWFDDHLRRICQNQAACASRLDHALFFVGEFGLNDYNAGLFKQKSVAEIQSYVPSVVRAITDAVKEVIHAGALRIVVPGIFPMGCIPVYLSTFTTPDTTAYDDMKCLRYLNKLAQFHNNHLKGALANLQNEYADVVILYGDYYTAFQWVLHRAPLLGFDETSILKACCGTGGAYMVNLTKMCGDPSVPVCPHPNQSISWDGIHLTQEAYRHIARWLLDDLLPTMEEHF